MPQSFSNRPHYTGTAQRGGLRSPSRSSSFFNKKRGSWWHHQDQGPRCGWVEGGYGGRNQGGRWTKGGTIFTRHYNTEEEPSILNRAKADSNSQISTSGTELCSSKPCTKDPCPNATPVPPEYECCWFEYIAWEVNSRPRATSWHGDTSDRMDDFLDLPCPTGEPAFHEEVYGCCGEKFSGSEQLTWTNFSQPEQMYQVEEGNNYYTNLDWEYCDAPDLQVQQHSMGGSCGGGYDSSAMYYETQTGEEYFNTGVVHSGAQYFEFGNTFYPDSSDWFWAPPPPPGPPLDMAQPPHYDHHHLNYGSLSNVNGTEDESANGNQHHHLVGGLRLTPV